MIFEQHTMQIKTQPLTCSLITSEVVRNCPTIEKVSKGFLNVFIRHTSASLTINENADADVRKDLVMSLDRIAPETFPYRHDEEGPDDMPAHVKTALTDVSIQIPITQGRLALGTWQGIYLCEHRSQPHTRELLCTVWGVGL